MPASSSPGPPATASQNQSQSQSHQIMKTKRRLYFGYGSNLWREQMALRCPKSEFLGVARLRGYRWMINERGYANVAEIISGLEARDTDFTGAGANGNTLGGEVQVQYGDEFVSKSRVADNEKEIHDNGDQEDDDDNDHENSVWGAVYSLTSSDEAALDINEGVPYAYEKRDVPGIEFWSVNSALPTSKFVSPILTDISSGARYHHLHTDKDRHKHNHKHKGIRGKTPEIVDMLVYIDFKRNDGEGYMPREEYIHRMNMGIRDALEAGVPRGYVGKVLRRWIPEEEEHSLDDDKEGDTGKKNKKATKKSNAKARELALSQARAFKDESGVIPSSGDDN